MWNVPESELGALPDVAGMDTVELGCGTAYISAWLARRGARPVGIDITPAQLETARRMQAEFGLDFPLLEASAEDVPLPDESFDLAISEYGASIWADPYRWIPEAARLLRPGGHLVFLVNGTIMILCSADEELPPGRELLRPYFGMHRFEWDGTGGIEFHLGYGDWIRLLRENGFAVENLIEIQAPPEGEPHSVRRDCPTASGRAAGPPRRSGSPASVRERPARTPAPPRLDLAAAAGDPRAAADPVRAGGARLRGARPARR